MATSITTTPDGDVYDVRPFNSTEIKQWYDAADVYTDGIDLAATETATDALIDAEGSLSEGEKTALKAAITAAIATNIAQPTFHDICDVMYTDMMGVIEADTTTFPSSGAINVCPQCLGAGKNQVLNADGSGSGDYVRSTVCDGYGKTATQYVKDPAAGFIEEP